MENKPYVKISAPVFLALIVLTIILAQQIIDTLFPIEGLSYTLGKMTIDLALVIIGLTLKKKTIADALLFAGVIRFVLIFFQLAGMDPMIRAVSIVAVVVVLFIIGYFKFGKQLNNQTQNTEVK